MVAIAILALLFELSEMLELIPRYVEPRLLSTTILVVVIAGGAIRRRALAEMKAQGVPGTT